MKIVVVFLSIAAVVYTTPDPYSNSDLEDEWIWPSDTRSESSAVDKINAALPNADSTEDTYRSSEPRLPMRNGIPDIVNDNTLTSTENVLPSEFNSLPDDDHSLFNNDGLTDEELMALIFDPTTEKGNVKPKDEEINSTEPTNKDDVPSVTSTNNNTTYINSEIVFHEASIDALVKNLSISTKTNVPTDINPLKDNFEAFSGAKDNLIDKSNQNNEHTSSEDNSDELSKAIKELTSTLESEGMMTVGKLTGQKEEEKKITISKTGSNNTPASVIPNTDLEVWLWGKTNVSGRSNDNNDGVGHSNQIPPKRDSGANNSEQGIEFDDMGTFTESDKILLDLLIEPESTHLNDQSNTISSESETLKPTINEGRCMRNRGSNWRCGNRDARPCRPGVVRRVSHCAARHVSTTPPPEPTTEKDHETEVKGTDPLSFNMGEFVPPSVEEILKEHKQEIIDKSDPCQFRFLDHSIHIETEGRRVSEIQCEYNKLQYKYEMEKDRKSKECASKTSTSKEKTTLIIGGRSALQGQFPHMGAVGWKKRSEGYKFMCGCSLISTKFAVTAAHCSAITSFMMEEKGLTSQWPEIVRFGSVNIELHDYPNNEGSALQFQDATIDGRFIKLKKYKFSLNYNDIALIKFTREVSIADNIRPACLWNGYLKGHTDAIVTGWGQTKVKTDSGTSHLQYAVLDFVDKSKCLDNLSESLGDSGLFDYQFCAGKMNGAVDTCQGDSGGPIQIREPPHEGVTMYHVVGVTSFGIGCALPDTPGVYTNVSDPNILCWIEKTVWPERENKDCPGKLFTGY